MTNTVHNTLKSESSTEIKDTQDTLRLVKLSPSQISKDWDNISDMFESVLPPTSSEKNTTRMIGLQKVLLAGAGECWVLLRGEKSLLIFTSYIWVDVITKDRNYIIYTLYGFVPIKPLIWTFLFNAVMKKAKEYKCNKVIGYSSVPRVSELAKSLGWDTECRFLSVEV